MAIVVWPKSVSADGTKVVTDHVKRVRLRTEKGERIMIVFRYPTLNEKAVLAADTESYK